MVSLSPTSFKSQKHKNYQTCTGQVKKASFSLQRFPSRGGQVGGIMISSGSVSHLHLKIQTSCIMCHVLGSDRYDSEELYLWTQNPLVFNLLFANSSTLATQLQKNLSTNYLSLSSIQ